MNNETVIIDIGCNEPPIVPKSVNHRCTIPNIKESFKELEVMDIDWSKAPEGATHYKFSKDNEGCFYKACDSEFALMFNGSEWLYTGWTTNDVIKNITKPWPVYFMPKPQPVLTYTQAMADNGELPSVGMNVEAYHGRIVEIMLPFDSTKFTVGKCKGGEYALYSIGELKPLAPPIELIHGEAYNFIDSECNNTNGIYSEDEHSFTGLGVEWLADRCTNIKPLTAEVK